MKTSKHPIPLGLIFAAGALVGAFAVYVPLASAGHPASAAAGRSSALAASEKKAEPTSASPMKRDSSTSNVANNETTCDVQLD